MKFVLATALALASFSGFALTNSRAITLVKASRTEVISNAKAVVLSKNLIQVNYDIKDGIVCSSKVKEIKNRDGLKVFTISEGFCFE